MALSSVKHTNRLIHESSPYLLQHAHNPVDWYPWGAEAFEAARRENKPIFLSVGYSTCYWCHVMERQCFENEQIAAEMNQRFINIKVDREERPDIDQLYMTAVQVLSKQGGWPMSVFLTPDLRPFYGGTYFPPTDMYGRPGFLTLLRAIDGAYHERPQDVQNTCIQLVDILQQLAEPQPPDTPMTINRELIHELVQRSTADFDAKQGGFGGAPKFPRQTLLEMLVVHLREMSPAQQKENLSQMLRRTLDAMADGGIRDHLGGGFHRYSTDAQWLVPHFEIMLYDNAMLAWVYAEASHQLQEPRYGTVARGILDFILREMTSPDGGFYTAFDAEVDAMEGQTYLWTREEILALLGPENGNLFCHVYGVDLGPNFADPHHGSGTPDRNILHLARPLADIAAEMRLTSDQLDQKLQPMRQTLLAARKKRKQPLLDTKILTSWNALAIRALAHAGRVLDEARYTAAANRAADHLLQKHLKPDGRLCRSRRDDIVKHDGFLDDYAFLIQALLELHSSDPHSPRRQQAASLAQRMVDLFADTDGSGLYFTAEDAKDLIVRQKVAADSPLPSGNAVAAIILLQLDQPVMSRDILTAFAGPFEKNPESMSSMLEAAILYLRRNDPIPISPGPWRPDVDRPPSPEKLAEMVVESSAVWIDPAELHIRCAISSQYHINSHQPRPGLVSTQLAVGGEAAELVEAIEYPPGEERRFAFAPDPLHIYQDTILIVVRFKRPMTGSPSLHLALSYQACTEDACLPPVTRTFEVSAP